MLLQLNCCDNDDSDSDDDDKDFDYGNDVYDDDDVNDTDDNDDDAIPCRNACGLAIGYSKSIVVDLGFVLQGNEEHELPEVLMGCYSCYRVDMSTGTRLI